MANTTAGPRNRSILILLVGGLLALIGLVLAAGGAWLAVLGGSLYYLLAGLGLIAAGYLLIRGRALGAYIYLGVFALTVLWALWESGVGSSRVDLQACKLEYSIVSPK